MRACACAYRVLLFLWGGVGDWWGGLCDNRNPPSTLSHPQSPFSPAPHPFAPYSHAQAVPAGGGLLFATGKMWVAPQAEADPRAISMQAVGEGLNAAALATGYLPPVSNILFVVFSCMLKCFGGLWGFMNTMCVAFKGMVCVYVVRVCACACTCCAWGCVGVFLCVQGWGCTQCSGGGDWLPGTEPPAGCDYGLGLRSVHVECLCKVYSILYVWRSVYVCKIACIPCEHHVHCQCGDVCLRVRVRVRVHMYVRLCACACARRRVGACRRVQWCRHAGTCGDAGMHTCGCSSARARARRLVGGVQPARGGRAGGACGTRATSR